MLIMKPLRKTHRGEIRDSGVVAEEGKGAIAPPKKKKINVEKMFRKFSSKNTKFGAKIPHFKEVRGKIKILSTIMSSVGKFAAICQKIATLCPPVVF